MRKILIIGNAGSGKSTLSKTISERTKTACFSLDKIVWKPNWQKTPASEQKQMIANLISQESWVIDGVDYDILRAADEVIFLDIPRKVCFYRAAKRNSRYLFSSRPELPANCPEILIIPELVKIIWRFPKRVRPKIIAEKNKRNIKSFTHITNNAELEAYLNTL